MKTTWREESNSRSSSNTNNNRIANTRKERRRKIRDTRTHTSIESMVNCMRPRVRFSVCWLFWLVAAMKWFARGWLSRSQNIHMHVRTHFSADRVGPLLFRSGFDADVAVAAYTLCCVYSVHGIFCLWFAFRVRFNGQQSSNTTSTATHMHACIARIAATKHTRGIFAARSHTHTTLTHSRYSNRCFAAKCSSLRLV